jgi:ubiquinol-cytochrome c reductase iron-sulfur subunit
MLSNPRSRSTKRVFRSALSSTDAAMAAVTEPKPKKPKKQAETAMQPSVDASAAAPQATVPDEKRRDFMVLTAAAMGGVGAAAAVWPLIDTMNPSAEVLAVSSIEQDLSGIKPGQSLKVMWRGKPVFIRHRTPEEIAEAQKVDVQSLPDPETDEARVKKGKEQWLVTLGICTHLGCVPLGNAGEYGGWLCPCHGSHYDLSGRIRKGPAPKNLEVPEYSFITDTMIRIG